jgi:Uncharacterised nucleotidyltransferase
MIDLFAAALRGDRLVPDRLGALDPGEVVREAERQGVLPLVTEAIERMGMPPPELREALRSRAGRWAGVDLIRESELVRLVDAFHAAGVRALLLKGAALAYTFYRRPDHRPRFDSDLLVAPTDRGAAEAILRALGYDPVRQVTGDLVMYQAPWVLKRDGAVVHVVDLHWRVANPQAFGDVLAFEELSAESGPIPSLGAHARGPGPVHTLLLACVHRVAHHFDAVMLIWEYDIHLVSSSLSDAQWGAFGAMAESRRITTVCRRGLDLAASRFGTRVPAGILSTSAAAAAGEASTAAYIAPRRHIQEVADDLRALPTWGARWRLVYQHLFPPVRYMRDVYAPASHAPLPVLYLRRALRGARKWLVRS